MGYAAVLLRRSCTSSNGGEVPHLPVPNVSNMQVLRSELPDHWRPLGQEGLEYQIVPKFWPRSQWGAGLGIKLRSRDEALRFFESLGYQLRLRAARTGGGHGGKPDV